MHDRTFVIMLAWRSDYLLLQWPRVDRLFNETLQTTATNTSANTEHLLPSPPKRGDGNPPRRGVPWKLGQCLCIVAILTKAIYIRGCRAPWLRATSHIQRLVIRCASRLLPSPPKRDDGNPPPRGVPWKLGHCLRIVATDQG